MSRVSYSMKPAFRLTAVPVALAAALLLGGCESYQKSHFTVGSIPQDYRTRHPIVVSHAENATDVVVSPAMRSISFRQRNIVVDVVGKFKRSGAKELMIFLPAGSHNEAAARHVAADMVHLMKAEGLHENEIRIERYHAANHGDAATIRLSFGTIGAHVASTCGEWDDDLGNTIDNVNYTNFGCATQNNLAAMVANPEDLLGPRGESEIDAERRDNVISDWRENGS